MLPFKFRWLHKLIRKNTNPIPEIKAIFWKRRLSFAYVFFAWNAFGILVYNYFHGQLDVNKLWGLKTGEELNKKPGEYYADLLGIKRAHVINIKQFKITSEYEYENKKEE